MKLPCCGEKIRERQATEDCQQAYQARIELARARLAAKQFDLVCAKRHLATACELSLEICDALLHADRHDVAALIHDQEENWLAAGAHRDREVELLRLYRPLPRDPRHPGRGRRRLSCGRENGFGCRPNDSIGPCLVRPR